MAVREVDDRVDDKADRVAFVLEGGGGLAAGQAGMLRALTEAGIVPDLVIGSSAGALNAVAFASDPTAAGLARLEAMWGSARRRTIFPLSPARLLAAFAGRGDGIASSAALRALIERGSVVAHLADTTIPAHVVVTDVATGEPVVLSDGETVAALLASSAIPGVFPPVRIGGRLYMDGGVAADTPILQAEALGATVSYVLPAAIASAAALPHGAAPLAFHALSQLLHHTAHADLAAARGRVHLLPAPTAATANPLVFRDTRRLVDEGYQLTLGWLRGGPAFAATGAPVQVPA
jgi:NTE family protein